MGACPILQAVWDQNFDYSIRVNLLSYKRLQTTSAANSYRGKGLRTKVENPHQCGLQPRLPRPSVSLSFQPDLSPEHAEQVEEVAESEDGAQTPPGEADGEAVLAGSGVVDGQIQCGIGAGRQDHGIQC